MDTFTAAFYLWPANQLNLFRRPTLKACQSYDTCMAGVVSIHFIYLAQTNHYPHERKFSWTPNHHLQSQ